MPRITETLKQQLDNAGECYDRKDDRAGGITLALAQARAVIEIADALKNLETTLQNIETHLATIAKNADTEGRATLEEMPPVGSRSRKPKG